jgi:hypothetical protein
VEILFGQERALNEHRTLGRHHPTDR